MSFAFENGKMTYVLQKVTNILITMEQSKLELLPQMVHLFGVGRRRRRPCPGCPKRHWYEYAVSVRQQSTKSKSQAIAVVNGHVVSESERRQSEETEVREERGAYGKASNFCGASANAASWSRSAAGQRRRRDSRGLWSTPAAKPKDRLYPTRSGTRAIETTSR